MPNRDTETKRSGVGESDKSNRTDLTADHETTNTQSRRKKDMNAASLSHHHQRNSILRRGKHGGQSVESKTKKTFLGTWYHTEEYEGRQRNHAGLTDEYWTSTVCRTAIEKDKNKC